MKRPVEMPVGIEEERTFGRSVYVRHAARNFARPFTSFAAFRRALAGFFPVIPLLADYKWREDFFPDLMSGLTVSSVLVPQSLAYALLAGVQPVNGLVSSVFSTFFYLLFGEVAHVSRGPSSVLGILAQISNDAVQERALARNVTVDPAVAAATLTFTIGIIHVAMAVLHFEFLSSFFSDSLVSGFVSAAAIHTVISQLPPLFGVHGRHFNGPFGVFARLFDLLSEWRHFNWQVTALSAASCAFLLVAKIHFSRCFSTPIPYELILIASTTAFSWRFEWRHKMAIVGDVPRGFPAPQMPAFDLLADCLPHALAISAVCLAMHLSMTKVFARQFKYTINARQEIYAIGLSSLFSAFFPVFPTSTALARSTVLAASGVRTTMANGVTSLMVLFVLLFVAPLFELLPKCILSTIIIVSLRTVLPKFNDPLELWTTDKLDFLIWTVTFTSTLLTNVVWGLAVGIAFSLLTVLFRVQRPTWHFAIVPFEKTGVECVFYFHGALLFTNADFFSSCVEKTLLACEQQVGGKKAARGMNSFVFDCSSWTEIDSMGRRSLFECVEIVRQSGFSVEFWNVGPDLPLTMPADRLETCGVSIDPALPFV